MQIATRTTVAWAMYDWANSAFPTLVITFVYATYFTKAMAPDEIAGTALWSRGAVISAIVIALLAPVLGAMADRGGHRRRYLVIASMVCCAASAGLAFVRPDLEFAAYIALGVFIIANIAFEFGMVFYNAFLPDIAPPERIGRVSGWAWGLGYVGGLLCLVVALVVLVRDVPLFGISTEAGFNFRATALLAGIWFAVFSIPTLLLVRDRPRPGPAPPAQSFIGAYREVADTVRHLGRYRETAKFLLARMIYNDGLVTVFAFGGIYAAGTFGMSLAEVIQFGIAINVAAGLGALAFGFIDDRLGGRRTLLVTLVGLATFTVVAVVAPSVAWLWAAAIGIGLFVGPNQSASRALLARLVPRAHAGEFFGFFAFSGKITAFIGPLLLGIATQWFDSQRAGVATVLVLFAVGGILLLSVNEKAGIRAAREQSGRPDSATGG